MARRITDTQQAKRTYACTNCGHPFDAYPPDDAHIEVSLTPCDQGDSIEIRYECDNCHAANIRHWDTHHFIVVSG